MKDIVVIEFNATFCANPACPLHLRSGDQGVEGAGNWGSGQIRANSSGFPESIQQNHAVARNTGCVGSALVTH
jgi:hypothetical protein